MLLDPAGKACEMLPDGIRQQRRYGAHGDCPYIRRVDDQPELAMACNISMRIGTS